MKALTMNQVAKVLAMSALFVSVMAEAGTKDSGALEYQPKGTVRCTEGDKVDGTYSLFIEDFEKGDKTPRVTLTVPRGETSVSTHKVLCPPMPGAIETALRCKLQTSQGETFDILIASPGDSSLIARIIVNGEYKEQVSLSCKRGFHNPIGGN